MVTMSRSFHEEHCDQREGSESPGRSVLYNVQIGAQGVSQEDDGEKNRANRSISAALIEPGLIRQIPKGGTYQRVYALLVADSYTFMTAPPATYPKVPVSKPASTSAT